MFWGEAGDFGVEGSSPNFLLCSSTDLDWFLVVKKKKILNGINQNSEKLSGFSVKLQGQSRIKLECLLNLKLGNTYSLCFKHN